MDDLAVAAATAQEISDIKDQLAKSFDIHSLGDIHFYLGCRVVRDRSTKRIWLMQDGYISTLGQRFNMTDCRPIDTPMDPNVVLTAAPEGHVPEKNMTTMYQSLIGGLMWPAITTRIDISFSTSMLSRFVSGMGPWHLPLWADLSALGSTCSSLAKNFPSLPHRSICTLVDSLLSAYRAVPSIPVILIYLPQHPRQNPLVSRVLAAGTPGQKNLGKIPQTLPTQALYFESLLPAPHRGGRIGERSHRLRQLEPITLQKKPTSSQAPAKMASLPSQALPHEASSSSLPNAMVWLGLYEAIDKNGLSTGDNARKPEGYDHVVPPQVKRALNFAFTLGLKDGQNGNEHARDLGVPPGDNDGYAASVLEQYYTAGNAYALKTFTGTINTGSTIHKAAGGTQAAPKVKISPPEPFNGDRTKYDKFATQLSLVFLANPAVYSNDQTRVTYAASYLRGPAADWWVPQMNSATGTLDASVSTYPGFLASLRAAFDDPGALEQVARDLQRLRQGKFTVSEYYAKFLTYPARALDRRAWSNRAVPRAGPSQCITCASRDAPTVGLPSGAGDRGR